MKYQVDIEPRGKGFDFSMKWPTRKMISGFDTSIESILKSLASQIKASMGIDTPAEAPAEDPQYYVIDFTYAENGQIFATGALLSKAEKAELENALSVYEEEGYIKEPSVYAPVTVKQNLKQALREIKKAIDS